MPLGPQITQSLLREPTRFSSVAPGAPGNKDSQEGATHAIDLGVSFPGPCGVFWSSAPPPLPLTPTYLRATRLWHRPAPVTPPATKRLMLSELHPDP